MKTKTKEILLGGLFYVLAGAMFVAFLMVLSNNAIAQNFTFKPVKPIKHFQTIKIKRTIFKKREYTSGMNKICVYNDLGSDYSITIQSYKLCPLSIKV